MSGLSTAHPTGHWYMLHDVDYPPHGCVLDSVNCPHALRLDLVFMCAQHAAFKVETSGRAMLPLVEPYGGSGEDDRASGEGGGGGEVV